MLIFSSVNRLYKYMYCYSYSFGQSFTFLLSATEFHNSLICPLSSRQVKYLKLSGKNTYISLWSVGIFYAHHFFLYFSIRLFSGIGYSTGMSDFSAS